MTTGFPDSVYTPVGSVSQTRKGEKRRIPNGERKRKSGGGCSAVEKLSLASLQLPIGYGDGKKLSEPSDPKRVSLPTEGHCQEHQR